MSTEVNPATYTTRQGDMVDAIAKARYGSELGGTTEAILIANPGLADRGPVLPENVAIVLPEIAPPTPRRIASVDLWS
jgi:phage tail protein X